MTRLRSSPARRSRCCDRTRQVNRGVGGVAILTGSAEPVLLETVRAELAEAERLRSSPARRSRCCAANAGYYAEIVFELRSSPARRSRCCFRSRYRLVARHAVAILTGSAEPVLRGTWSHILSASEV